MPPQPLSPTPALVAGAALPIAVVLVLMLGPRWSGARAGAVGWTAAALSAVWLFGANATTLAVSQGKGLFLSLYVLYIIWSAVALYHVVAEADALRSISAGVARLTADRTLQMLLLGWVFASFLQGVTGFGVPVAVVAPLLVGLGFPPLASVVAASIGHSWAVTFGSVASSFYAMLAVTGMSVADLGSQTAVLLGLAAPVCGLVAAYAVDGRRSVVHALPAVAAIGSVMAVVQYEVVVRGPWQLAAFLAGLAGLAAAAAVARMPPYARSGSSPPSSVGPSAAARSGSSPPAAVEPPSGSSTPAAVEPSAAPPGPLSLPMAVSAYGILLVVVTMGQLVPPLADALNKVTIAWRFPATSTSLGWHNAAGAGRSISLFGHAGALILYACALGYLAYRRAGAYRSGAFGRIVRDTAADAIRPTGAILALVGMALMMGETGMTSVLARAMANAAGAWFPLVAPFIGALGAFMTGSNTNSNVVFAPLQLETARLLHLSAPWLLAAQNLGGAIGSSFAPAKVIVACSTVGLAKGGEGTVLRRNVAFGLLIVGAGAIVTALIVAHVSG